MRTQHAFALESDLLGDALRRAVLRIGHELDALELELLERVPREQSKGARAGALAPCRAATQ